MDSVRGQLLIAGPALLDPNFWRTVVLVVEHNDEARSGWCSTGRRKRGRRGRPAARELLDPTERLFIGGPVQPSAVIVLAEFEEPTDAALLAFDDVGVLGDRLPAEELAAGVAGRAFVGHAGWGPGSSTASSSAATGSSSPRSRDAFAPSRRTVARC